MKTFAIPLEQAKAVCERVADRRGELKSRLIAGWSKNDERFLCTPRPKPNARTGAGRFRKSDEENAQLQAWIEANKAKWEVWHGCLVLFHGWASRT